MKNYLLLVIALMIILLIISACGGQAEGFLIYPCKQDQKECDIPHEKKLAIWDESSQTSRQRWTWGLITLVEPQGEWGKVVLANGVEAWVRLTPFPTPTPTTTITPTPTVTPTPTATPTPTPPPVKITAYIGRFPFPVYTLDEELEAFRTPRGLLLRWHVDHWELGAPAEEVRVYQELPEGLEFVPKTYPGTELNPSGEGRLRGRLWFISALNIRSPTFLSPGGTWIVGLPVENVGESSLVGWPVATSWIPVVAYSRDWVLTENPESGYIHNAYAKRKEVDIRGVDVHSRKSWIVGSEGACALPHPAIPKQEEPLPRELLLFPPYTEVWLGPCRENFCRVDKVYLWEERWWVSPQEFFFPWQEPCPGGKPSPWAEAGLCRYINQLRQHGWWVQK